MTEHEYIQAILRTYSGTEEQLDKLCLGALGLSGESGEVADLIKKRLFHGHPMDLNKLRDELGDVLWYFMLICHTLGFSLEEVMVRNVEKLQERYPDGFETVKSLAR